jgi:hypothetical protein
MDSCNILHDQVEQNAFFRGVMAMHKGTETLRVLHTVVAGNADIDVWMICIIVEALRDSA